MLLGVSDDLVMREYLLTNKELLPAEQPLLDHFRALGGDPDVLLAVVAVAAEYLEAALDEMRRRFGTVERYFAEALKIGEVAQKTLRAALVTPASRAPLATTLCCGAPLAKPAAGATALKDSPADCRTTPLCMGS